LRNSRTFDQIISEQAGQTTGFDYLRVGLALGVLLVHVAVIADHHISLLLWTTWFGPFERSLLPAFFVLSGFLVSGSLLRNSLPRFLALRVLRIIPALAVEVGLSAVVMGFLFTKLSWTEYAVECSPSLRHC
jgi:peptidoglycan/LPS O-acetylase OafA/YrhL